MIICSFLILQVISTSLSYDIEVAEIVKLGNKILKHLYPTSNAADLLKVPLKFLSKGKLPNNLVGTAVMRALKENNKTDFDFFKHYTNHLLKNGETNLKDIANEILNHINITKNVTSILQNITDDYNNIMKQYYEFVTKNQSDLEIDREFDYLDMLEMSYEMLYNEERKLLDNITKDQNLSAQNQTLNKLDERIHKRINSNKNEEMKYLCEKYGICKEYPGFTDFCAKLLNELLQLPYNEFEYIVDILTKILKHNEAFFAMMSDKEDRDLITIKLKFYSTNVLIMKEFFAAMRGVITQRFKAVWTDDEKLRVRTKAARILMDILDKALVEDKDLLSIDFDNTIAAVKYWSDGQRTDINNVFKDFIAHFLRMLDYNLTKNARTEIRSLIKTIMSGSVEDDKVIKRLFKYGSSFVKGEDFHSNLEVLSL